MRGCSHGLKLTGSEGAEAQKPQLLLSSQVLDVTARWAPSKASGLGSAVDKFLIGRGLKFLIIQKLNAKIHSGSFSMT